VRLRPRERSGELVLVAENLAVGYDPAGPLASAERIEVTRGRRIAVVGPNGIGKTTLLKTILGEVEPLSGTIKHGARVETGYLSQTHAELRERDTALDAVLSARKGATEQEGRNVLGGLLLSGDEALKSVSVLSGGERSRVLLGEIAIQNANFLILDEPTNHLDIPSTEIMQELLRSFDGTLLFVSHDRYLIRAVATHVWALADGRIHVIHGAWDEYMEWRARRAAAVAAAPSAEKLDRREDYHKRRREAGERRRLQRQHEKIEADIAALERELAALYDNISLASEGGDVDAVDRLSAEYSRGEARLKRLLDEWEELGEELG
jgi:ATP-binding cassette subfamily F protein 3